MSRPGQLVNPAGPRTRALVTQDIYRPRGHSDPDPSQPGQLIETAGPQVRVRVVRESWSTPRELRPKSESSRTAGDTADPRTGL